MSEHDELLDELVARYIAARERDQDEPDDVRLLTPEELVGDRADLVEPLRQRLALVEDVELQLISDFAHAQTVTPTPGRRPARGESTPLLDLPGFKVIERLGGGGMGEVFKLHDEKLDRMVAGKVLRPGTGADMLHEARALARFRDPSIVQVHQLLTDRDPPVLLMELVEGFELGEIGPSLEHVQVARILATVCEAIQRAHDQGIQHRDLKPSNILLDAELAPKIVDFGLAASNSEQGHFTGTLPYMAPEQLTPGAPIDDRADVYALGVILYQLLAGELPYQGENAKQTMDAILAGDPRLPVEIEPLAPEPLQAIALKAMELRREDRYVSAHEMALDLRRMLEGRSVLGRPTNYGRALGRKLAPHLREIDHWRELKLVHPHEADRLQAAYRQLEARDEDWIVAGRSLTMPRVTLYLGAFLLWLGGLYYLFHHVTERAGDGLIWPLAALLPPLLISVIAGERLWRQGHRAVAVAFFMAAAMLPAELLYLTIAETGWLAWLRVPGDPMALLSDLAPPLDLGNRELELVAVIGSVWCLWLARRSRTLALGSTFAVAATLTGVVFLCELGLRDWLEHMRLHDLGRHLLLVCIVLAGMAAWDDRRGRRYLATPLYLAASLTLAVALELLTLDGKALASIGVSLGDPVELGSAAAIRLDTLAGMTLVGLVLHGVGWALERGGADSARPAATVLNVISPFATLEPVLLLCRDQSFSATYDWVYLALAITFIAWSQIRQRRSFYYAGLLNTGAALHIIATRREWLDDLGWPISVLAAGLIILLIGAALELLRHRPGYSSLPAA